MADTRTKQFKALAALLGSDEAAHTALAAVQTTPAPTSTKETVDALIADKGFVPVRGRVYATGAVLEAGARVLKGGSPQIVNLPGDHRVRAVAVYPASDETVAFQNLGQQD